MKKINTEFQEKYRTGNTMLIVDDSEINRAVLAEIFKSRYNVIEAQNGSECLGKLDEYGADICAVLLDVVMPSVSGIDVLKAMRKKDLLTIIPVFLITAEASDSVMKEGYALGVMDVIQKPIVPYIVERRVESVIELFRSRKYLHDMVELQKNEIYTQSEKIIELNMGMVETLSTAIEFRSCESGEHVRRIHNITNYLLKNTPLGNGLSNEQIRLISIGAIMHDVGKIAVSDTILNKPGRLTNEEFEIMKTHTVQGAKLLEQIPQMRNHEAYQYAHDIALHHHERWDGHGYPDGLVGNETAIWTQVVALADVYDALVSKRVYKEAYSFDNALKMIVEGNCGVFNPKLIENFIQSEPVIRGLYST